MNTENKQELYTSPEVKIVEIKARQVVCQSGGRCYTRYDSDILPEGKSE